MTEHTTSQQSAAAAEHTPHACQHKSEDSALWRETKEAGHRAAEKNGSMWESTKDVTSDVWEKTKEVGSDAWNATKNFAGHVGNALTGHDDDDDEEIEAYYTETDYLDDEENEHLNKTNKRINDEYENIHHASENRH